MEGDFVARINQERAAQGLATLSVAGDLVAVARSHSGRMAGAGELYHNPNLGGDVANWQTVGENVGRGASVGELHGAFMASPSHRDNVLDDDWSQIGVGVAVASDGRVYVTEVFRQPAGSAPAPEPEPQPESAAAPQPESEAATDEPAAAAAPEPEPEPTRPPAQPTDTNTARAPQPVRLPAQPTDTNTARAPQVEPTVPRFERAVVVVARLEAAERGTSLAAVLDP